MPLMMVRRTDLHGLHHVKIRYVFVSELWMFREMHVFFGHHDALFKEELIDSNAILLGHQHLQEQKHKYFILSSYSCLKKQQQQKKRDVRFIRLD